MTIDIGQGTTPHRRTPGRGIALPATVAVGCVAFGAWFPWVSPLLLALAVGAIVANAAPLPDRTVIASSVAAKIALRLGIVGLGLQISFGDLAGLGLRGGAIVVATVAITYTSTRVIGRRLGVDEPLTTLIASGFSICGAAAIAAVSDVVRARSKDVSIAVALVTVFGTLTMFLLPTVAGILPLTQDDAAIWAGASIHEVAQVVGAASLLGSGALAAAMAAKLGRVVLLAPTMAVALRREPGDGPAVQVPWFVTGFLVAALITTIGVLPTPAQPSVDTLTKILLTAGMFGLGLGVRVKDLWPINLRAVILASVATGIVCSVPLALLSLP